MGFTDPAAGHNPAASTVAPASWGDQLNTNQNWFANPARVKVYRSSNLTITTATDSPLTWNAEEWDTDTMHSTGSVTERLVATTAGRYMVVGTIVFAAGSTATVGRRAQLWHGGTSGVLVDSDIVGTPHATGYTRLKIAAEVELAAAEYVGVQVYQDSTVNLDVIGNSLGTSERSHLSMRWVGTV